MHGTLQHGRWEAILGKKTSTEERYIQNKEMHMIILNIFLNSKWRNKYKNTKFLHINWNHFKEDCLDENNTAKNAFLWTRNV